MLETKKFVSLLERTCGAKSSLNCFCLIGTHPWGGPGGVQERSGGARGVPAGLQEGVGVRFGAGVRASIDVFCLAFSFFAKRAPVQAKPLFFRSRGVEKRKEIVKKTVEVA